MQKESDLQIILEAQGVLPRRHIVRRSADMKVPYLGEMVNVEFWEICSKVNGEVHSVKEVARRGSFLLFFNLMREFSKDSVGDQRKAAAEALLLFMLKSLHESGVAVEDGGRISGGGAIPFRINGDWPMGRVGEG